MNWRMLHDADRQALARLLAAEPMWRRDGTAGALVGLPRDVLLHAGPPLAGSALPPAPILNSACVAAVFEGLASTLDEAERAIAAGAIRLAPAQDHGIVTPLAAVVSASMLLHEVGDAAAAGRAVSYAPINGGGGPAPRLGRRDMAVVEHLRWLNGSFAAWLAEARRHPIPLIPLADRALAAGDDCHGRTVAATALLRQQLSPAPGGAEARFLEQGPSFFLNLWMAACRCMLTAAAGEPGASLVVAAGGNGRETGIQLAGLPGRWFRAPARPPRGHLGPWPEDRALGAIGDSAIVDVLGFGAMAMAHAPAQREALGRFMPADGLQRPAELLAARHPAFRRVVAYCGLPARRVVALGRTPLISLGILDARGEAGRLGGGIYEMPLEPFAEAVAALDAA
jgi:hypothetical protein